MTRQMQYLKVDPSPIPDDLKQRQQWVCWRAENREGKTTKVPYDPKTGRNASSTDSSTWAPFEEALKASTRFDGISFGLTSEDLFSGIDLDHCINETGELEPWAEKIIGEIDSYTEKSPSGTGIRIFLRGKLPPGGRKKGGIEAYETGRFLTVTGRHFPGTPTTIEDRQEQLTAFHREIFGEPQERIQAATCTVELTAEDLRLIEKAKQSRNGFSKLWAGDFSDYPSQSEADQALCNRLAFWLNRDPVRIDAAFRKSGLYREKWDKRHFGDGRTYGEETIRKAVESCKEVYRAGKPEKPLQCPKGFTAAELMCTKFPEPKWAIPGILPEGLNILAGKPKKGKSILSLNVCLSITTVGRALGRIDTETGSAIYLALEDPPKRLQKRIRMMLTGRAPDRLHLFPQGTFPRMPEGLRLLETEIQKHQDLRLVVIDTFAKFKPADNGRKNSNAYDVDYEHVSALKELADRHSVAFLLIHHLRKTEADDVFDNFSGTLGLTGAADGLLALIRKSGQADAELHITGRDMEPAELALKFDPQLLAWNLMGKVEDVKSTQERQALYDALKNYGHPISPKELSETTGLKYKYIRNALPLLVKEGCVMKVGRGNYLFVKGNGDNEGIKGNEGNGHADRHDCPLPSIVDEPEGNSFSKQNGRLNEFALNALNATICDNPDEMEF